MASITHHLLTNLEYNNEYTKYEEKDLIRFLAGAIAPDSARAGSGKDVNQKNISHFLTKTGIRDMNAKFSIESEIPEINIFIDKYKERLSDPFILGYLVHLITDSYWFSEFLIYFVNERVKEIKESANDLSEITMGEAFNWYKENVFNMFNYHDKILSAKLDMKLINELANFDVADCPVDEVDKDDLKNLLKNLPQKYFEEFDTPESDLISISQIEEFFKVSTQIAHNLIKTPHNDRRNINV